VVVVEARAHGPAAILLLQGSADTDELLVLADEDGGNGLAASLTRERVHLREVVVHHPLPALSMGVSLRRPSPFLPGSDRDAGREFALEKADEL
jgi:hypothetical protein